MIASTPTLGEASPESVVAVLDAISSSDKNRLASCIESEVAISIYDFIII